MKFGNYIAYNKPTTCFVNIDMIKIVQCLVLAVLLTTCYLQVNAQLNRRNDQTNQQGNPYGRQQKPDSSFVDHLRWGFSGGASGGYGGGYIEIDPQLGYQFNKQFIAGIGFSYSYISEALFDPYSGQYTGNYSTSNYGGRIFAEYHFLPMLFLHIEYEAMNFDYQYVNNNPSSPLYNTTVDAGRTWVGNPLIGLGYQAPLGRKSYYYILILYDLNFNDPPSAELYGYSPFIPRIGFMFGF